MSNVSNGGIKTKDELLWPELRFLDQSLLLKCWSIGSVGYSALAALFSASILHFVHGVLCTVVRWLGGWGHDNRSEKFFTGLSVRSPSYLLTAIPACQFGHKGKDCQICLKDQN